MGFGGCAGSGNQNVHNFLDGGYTGRKKGGIEIRCKWGR
jgi:hypothetical protein